MSLTTDRADPRLTHGIDAAPVTQAAVYLVLSAEERAKGFVRPVRDTYRHVGIKPSHPLRTLAADDEQRLKWGYVAYEAYPEDRSPVMGRYWTQAKLDARACGATTTMGRALAETYARDPAFYGATYCCGCSKHRPVEEFHWEPDGSVVGS